MKKLIFTALALSILVFAFASCGKKEDKKEENTSKIEKKTQMSTEEKTEKSTEAKKEEAEESKEDKNPTAIDFTLKDKDGNDLKLSDYKGKVIFLNFFTTWCGYCKKELPDFEKLSKEYKDDVTFLIVDAFTAEKISVKEVHDWYSDAGYTMPMVVDEEGKAMEIYPVQGFPTTYIIDKDFKVLGYLPGMISEEDAKNYIEGILEK